VSRSALRDRLVGCYVAVPTMFRDDDLSVDVDALRAHVRFLLDGGLRTGTGVLLTGGGAGDFSTMTFDERVLVAETIIEAADGRIPVAMGGQTTSTLELVRLVKAAERIGADFVQVSPPFYFEHTEDDFLEYVEAAAGASDIGLIIYNTFWTSFAASSSTVERLAAIPSVAALKWATPDVAMMTFERVITSFSDRFSIIDNQMKFVVSHILGARAIELHVATYWPQFGVRMWELLEAGSYVEVQREMVRVAMPFMQLWTEIESYTSGDGYLDKLCMELVGLPSSRCRPPTRDVRDLYRERVRQMLIETGVPGVIAAG
jgi:dihydrodipicolinate synthase/N-acetylneuraminate lyase